MPIPPHLREFAQLGGEVLVLGAIDRVELWSPPVWDDRVRPSERQLTDA
jgi:MraZ protein